MAIDKVREYFKKFDIQDRILEFDDTSATVSEAAKRLNTQEARIAKSLTFWLNDKPIMIVMAGDARINNSKIKSYFKQKISMLKYDEVELIIGHNVGGVCPFAINSNVLVYLDESLKRFDTVFPACGSENSAIELKIKELEKYSNFSCWIDVCTY